MTRSRWRLGHVRHYSNRDLKEVRFYDGRIRELLSSKLLYSFIRSCLISIVRGRLPFKIFFIEDNCLRIYCGVKSKSQKYVYEYIVSGEKIYRKYPKVVSARNMLETEAAAILFFNSIGVPTMERHVEFGKYAYKGVNGIQKFDLNLVLTKYTVLITSTEHRAILPVAITEYLAEVKRSFNVVKEYWMTASHGDLTSWNTFIVNDELVLIDLERFKRSRIKYYDIFYYLLSELILRRKENTNSIMKNLAILRNQLKIDFEHQLIILLWIRYEKIQESKDGFKYRERTRYLSVLEELIGL